MSRKLRVLMVHNYYQLRGGEEVTFEAEKDLLEQRGHEVIEYVDHNERIKELSALSAAVQTVWSNQSYQALLKLLRKTQPDVAHFHNTFFMISPSAYYACSQQKIPVIQTLHNYRLLCPSAMFLRNGEICELCLHKTLKLPGVRHGCYRGSRGQTAVVTAMTSIHSLLQTWNQKVNAYIALTSFARAKFVEGGLPAEKIFIKPNFVQKIDLERKTSNNFVMFFGRLAEEKGLRTLLAAWKRLDTIPLQIAGKGPLEQSVIQAAQNNPNIRYLGHCDRPAVHELVASSRFVIVPSLSYETLSMSTIETFAQGVPVLASRLGVLNEVVQDGKTGLLFNPGDPDDLASKARWLWEHPHECAEMGRNARREYEQKYTPEVNYKTLLAIYENTLNSPIPQSK